jgi:hypothetical protein
MTTLFDSAAPVKSARPFGTPPSSEDLEPYTAQDLQDAAEKSGDSDEENRRLEEQALQAAWDDRFIVTIPAAGVCQMCGDACDDLTFQGLCDRCDDLACEATIAGQNARAGLGYRVF